MSRAVPSSILTALAQPEVSPFYAVRFNFDSGVVRFWTGYGERVIGGETYIGTGKLLSIGGLEEVADMSAKSATLVLSGIPSDLISLALQEPYQNRECRIYFGVEGSNDVVNVFGGLMNQMEHEDGPESGSITLTVESMWVKLERAVIRRYTSESQKSRYPNDTFFDWVADLQDKEFLWGRTEA